MATTVAALAVVTMARRLVSQKPTILMYLEIPGSSFAPTMSQLLSAARLVADLDDDCRIGMCRHV